MKKLNLFILVTLFALPLVHAELHTTLLAAQEVNGTLIGSTADAYLEIQDGKGRVFLETFPLTKVDTQISTRFAKEISCNYFDIDCSDADFIYTIRSDAVIIGGPSAGAAIAALTTAGLLGLELDEDVAVTGTINSGGLIGPVGGIKAKIDAAAGAGLNKVLIPLGTRMYNESENIEQSNGDTTNSDNNDNSTIQKTQNGEIDLIEYGKEKGVEVIEVASLGQVLEEFTGKQLVESNQTFVIHPEYTKIMKRVSELLCTRAKEITTELNEFRINQSDKDDIINKTNRASQAAQEQSYYAAASYCFGLNVQLRTLLYEKQELKSTEIDVKTAVLQSSINKLRKKAEDHKLTSIADLQTQSIVLDRVEEAQRHLDDLKENRNNNGNNYSKEESQSRLALAEERLYSAQAWSEFFTMGGSEVELNKENIRNSCIKKIQEAKERQQYVELFLGNVNQISENIDRANDQYRQEKYAQCLITASEAKSSANAILSTIGVEEDQLQRVIDTKMSAIQSLIARTVKKDAFPILGFSYYEYSKSLGQYDKQSALLYSEYALELSNLDIYFSESGTQRIKPSEFPEWIIFTIGLVIGVLWTSIFFVVLRKKK